MRFSQKGEITDVGKSSVTIYGFVYAKHRSPTVWDSALPFTWDNTLPISQGKAFEGIIKSLAAGTYYFRAYAHNSQGTAYGEEFSFTITGGDCTGGVPGDLNGDGNIDLTDVIIALKILDNIPIANLNLKADVNGDCKIGLEEAIFVLQKLGIPR
ncbi:MAG: hypothetical protein HC887_09055 [Desulfobacteraceae bacterium]|nr:hypothetical protein [Desulfobacteraceae bacterium]